MRNAERGTGKAEFGDSPGAEFWFTVHLDKQVSAGKPAAVPATLFGSRILVVDDNATNREVLTAQLTSWGVRSEAAAGAREALGMLRRAETSGEAFEAVLLDFQMPDMDGAELGRHIASDITLQKPRLVMMSSMSRQDLSRDLREAGFSASLRKPVSQSDLFDCINEVLSGDGTGQASSEGCGETASSRPGPRTGHRLLLVEDNSTNRQVALGLLTKLGLEADVAHNGREALSALREKTYDLILMDIQMPEMDGLEATRKIRNWELESDTGEIGNSKLDIGEADVHPSGGGGDKAQEYEGSAAVNREPGTVNPNIPIIAMTAHALQGDRERCLAGGMDDYLPKPIDPKLLAAVLEKWLPAPEAGMNPASGDGDPTAGAETPPVEPFPGPASPEGVPGSDPDGPQAETSGDKPLEIFDKAALLDRVMNDEDLARQVIAGFLKDMPDQMEQMQAALKNRDFTALQGQAHSIKGAAANVGGESLRRAALTMEQAAGKRDVDTANALIPEMQQSFAELREAMASLASQS